MINFIGRRFLTLLPTMMIPLVLVFFLIRLAPGDPAAVMLGDNATPEQVASLREALGFNNPIYIQFFAWLKQIFLLDLGDSIFLKQPVIDVVISHAGVTLQLTLYALIIAVVVGILSGIISAIYRNSVIDQTVMLAAMIGVSLPEFWFGLNLILIFSVGLGWFPVTGYVPLSEGFFVSLHSLTLPAVALGLIQAAFIARITRSSMLDVINEDFIRTAKAKGIPNKLVVFKHILKNAMIPILTVIGITMAILMGGAIAIETVFNLPGIGRTMLNAVVRRDYPLIQGLIVFISLVFIIINLLVDIVYAFIDPRVKYK
ncbi:ABC transporter permease [Neobacillus sp. NPDC097160]|uniref:ABC transporter permease n=1 Tax=Neobacillus sp. NPDC097160 TaxID=3364298 RepID=UPI00381C3873